MGKCRGYITACTAGRLRFMSFEIRPLNVGLEFYECAVSNYCRDNIRSSVRLLSAVSSVVKA